MFTRFIVCLILLAFVGKFPDVAWAADENMDSSVYLTFDPATGQFTSATKQLSDTSQFVDTGIDQGQPVPVQVAAQPVAAVNAIEQSSPSTVDQANDQTSLLWPGGIIALLLFGIIGFIMRKSQQKSAV